jgi:hypothetical protein
MQLPDDKVVDPFGEVNVFPGAPGMVRVRATILMAPSVENASVALATDASRSMLDNFGGAGLSPIFKKENQVELVARTMAEYLANFSGDGKVSLAYWAVGTGGAQVLDLGRVDAGSASSKQFHPPQNMGTGTMLLPAVKHFSEGEFKSSKWAMVVFITDGVLDDLQAVKDYTFELAREISGGRRGFLKLVIIGIGADCDESQMEELDDLLDDSGLRDPVGNDIDIWDHSMAANMKSLAAIFKEVVSRNTIVAPSASIVDDRGMSVKSDPPFSDGLPAIFEFEMPAGSASFTLTLSDGQKFMQPVK